MGFFGPSSSHSSHHGYGGSSHYRSGSHYNSRPSLFGGRSFYSRGSSYYKRRPRDGFVNKLMWRLKTMLRDLYYYARRHPVKFFMMVVMPLISSGALVGVARQFGIRLPAAMGGGHGGMGSMGSSRRYEYSRSGGGGGGGYYGSEGYGSGGGGFSGGMGNIASGLGGLSSLMGIAKNFM